MFLRLSFEMKDLEIKMKVKGSSSLPNLIGAYALLFLFSFLSFGQNSQAFAGSLQSEIVEIQKTTFHFSSDHSAPLQQPIGLPLNPEPNPEDSDEKETKESKEDKFSESVLSTDNEKYQFAYSLKTTYTQNNSPIQPRESIPFYILFQSWKSFLI